MSVVSDEGRLVGTGLPILPRVNLLPPEIAERRRFRTIQYGLAGAVVAALGVVALLYLAAAASVSSAQKDVDAASARNAQLNAQVASFGNVTALYNQAASAQAMLVQAMGDEVRYSHLLNDFSLFIPENVWVSNLSYTSSASPAGVANFAVTCTAFTHNDVAVWLDTLAAQKDYAGPEFGSSTEGLLGTRPTVGFSSTATVTPNALSHRYSTPIGG